MKPRLSRKVQLKVKNEEGIQQWVHFCYLNPEICDAFLKATNTKQKNLSKWLTKWAKEDFHWEIDFTEYSHIQLLKELVIDKYKSVYPHLYYNKAVDTHGWMRCWVSEKMGKEIRRYDKPTYNKLFRSAPNYRS